MHKKLSCPCFSARLCFTPPPRLQFIRSLLDGRVTASTSSRIYLNLLADVEGTPKDAIENFKRTMALLQVHVLLP